MQKRYFRWVASIFLLCISSTQAIAEDDFLSRFNPPEGYILTNKTHQGASYTNEKDDSLLVIATMGKYVRNFAQELKDERFAKGIIDGQIESGAMDAVSSHNKVQLEGITALELNGTTHIKSPGTTIANKKIFFVKDGVLFCVSLIGLSSIIKQQDGMFGYVVRTL